LIVAAHPDDEVIGAAGILRFFRDARVIHVTDGAPRDMREARVLGLQNREQYATLRESEGLAALAIAGITSDRVTVLGIVDQEASLRLYYLVQSLLHYLIHARPRFILTHSYEGGHPDHDATSFAVHAAVAVLAQASFSAATIVEFTSYHASASGVAVFDFLPGPTSVRTIGLSNSAQERKRRMFECHGSQAKVLKDFPVTLERFRLAPKYDFSHRPHQGSLYYEQFDWGMTAPRWCSLARDALRELGLSGAL
jgi:LmbE family N-acetylglucosaminyl deacetylase